MNLPQSSNVESASSTQNLHFRRRRQVAGRHLSSQHASVALLGHDSSHDSSQDAADSLADVLRHPRVMELCNWPTDEATNDEGMNLLFKNKFCSIYKYIYVCVCIQTDRQTDTQTHTYTHTLKTLQEN